MAQLATGCVHVFATKGIHVGYSSPAYDPAFAMAGSPAPRDPNPIIIGGIQYLGTCESMPKDERQMAYVPLMTDSSGVQIPYDLAWQGSAAQISLSMTRVIQSNIELVLATPPRRRAGFLGQTIPGKWNFSDVGTLMMLEGLTWQLFLVYQFTGINPIKPAYAAFTPTRTDQGLRPGRRYAQTILWTPQSDETGTKGMKQHLMFYAWPKPDYQASTYTLYDYDIPANIGDFIE